MSTALHAPYDRSRLSVGIVHLGPGAFHRAHQAWFLDELMRTDQGHDWAICDVGLLPGDADRQAAMRAQDCLYTVTTRHPDGTWSQRTIGSIIESLHAPDDPEAVLARMAAPSTRIVTLTITEGGYGRDDSPTGALGYLTQALRRRHDNGVAPFTVVSCDNLVGNGSLLRDVLLAHIQRADPNLADWVTREVRFPNSMVDRITPVTSAADLIDLPALTGVTDRCPVVAEPFLQWVLEDTFTTGRPPLERVGVDLVDDVEPYEQMKLRMLNASHQVMAHLGRQDGYRYVHEAIRDPTLNATVARFLTEEAAPSVTPFPGMDLTTYAETLLQRYSNASLADSLDRIAAFATDRLQSFLIPVIRARLAHGIIPSVSIATIAAWARWCIQTCASGDLITDNRSDAIAAVADRDDPIPILEAVEVFGDLVHNTDFVAGVRDAFFDQQDLYISS